MADASPSSCPGASHTPKHSRQSTPRAAAMPEDEPPPLLLLMPEAVLASCVFPHLGRRFAPHMLRGTCKELRSLVETHIPRPHLNILLTGVESHMWGIVGGEGEAPHWHTML